MTRALVLALVLAPAVAAAHRPMPRLPAIARMCPKAANYAALETCLHKLGDVRVERALPHAKLLHVARGEGEAAFDLGLGLYIEDAQGWHLGGVFEPRGRAYEVIAAQPLVVGQHIGYRIDVGESQRTWVSLDSVGSVQAILVSRDVLLCGGDRWRCSEIVLACDTLVHGGAVFTFRGELSITDNNQAHVSGDRTHAGAECNAAQDTFLGWSQP